MKIQYFEDTDTLYIIFSQNSPVETMDLDENTLIDLDQISLSIKLENQLVENEYQLLMLLLFYDLP